MFVQIVFLAARSAMQTYYNTDFRAMAYALRAHEWLGIHALSLCFAPLVGFFKLQLAYRLNIGSATLLVALAKDSGSLAGSISCGDF